MGRGEGREVTSEHGNSAGALKLTNTQKSCTTERNVPTPEFGGARCIFRSILGGGGMWESWGGEVCVHRRCGRNGS